MNKFKPAYNQFIDFNNENIRIVSDKKIKTVVILSDRTAGIHYYNDKYEEFNLDLEIELAYLTAKNIQLDKQINKLKTRKNKNIQKMQRLPWQIHFDKIFKFNFDREFIMNKCIELTKEYQEIKNNGNKSFSDVLNDIIIDILKSI